MRLSKLVATRDVSLKLEKSLHQTKITIGLQQSDVSLD